MYNHASSPTITNVTFTGNNAPATPGGGGMNNVSLSAPVISNCTFTRNNAASGGGIRNNNSSPTISNCSFIDNRGNSGGGIAIEVASSPTISNCTFTLNWSSNGGGIRSSSTTPPTITNSTFIKNGGSNGAGLYTGAANISNCTFFGNDAGTSGDDMVATSATIVNNCIIWGNISGANISGISGAPTINNSIVQYGYSGCSNCPNTNGNANPVFVNATDADGADNIHRTADDGIRLLSSSPAIDAGDNSLIPSGITTDITGAARIQNTTVDLGAYEGGVFVCPVATTLYVDQSVSSSGAGTSWATAFKTLDEALFIAHNCPSVTTINVATGTYIPAKKPYENGEEMTTADDRDVTFHLPDGIAIYGGFPNGGGSQDVGANPTILSGDIGTVIDNSDNTYHVVLASASSIDGIGVTIDGFSITGGNANESGIITVNGNDIEVGYGGGIATYYGTNTLTNNTFLGNLAFSGGGMYSIEGMNSLTDNTFSGNSAYSEGGGMYIIQGMNSFTNNTFSGNLADFFGGGIYIIEGTNSLTNNTFSGNSAIYDGGGIYTFEGTNTLSNNTLSGNLAEIGGGLYIYDGMNSLTNNTFSENSASFDGGGIYTFLGTHTFANNTFSGNSANFGGGMYIIESINSLTNNTFSGNSASFDGGGIYTFDGTNTLSNNIFWGNKIGTDATVQSADYYADGTNGNTFVNNLLQFESVDYPEDDSMPYGIGVAATGNIFATNPIFVNASDIDGADNIHRTADDGLRLIVGSPAINSGENSVVTELTDITGAVRIQNTTVDMGAYEGGVVVCPDLTAAAPPAIVSSESSCTGCALSGGVIAPPATACPTGSTLEYSTDAGSNWSTTLPTYNQTTAVTVLTRCNCNADTNTSSPTSSVTTVPGVCTPVSAGITNDTGTTILTCTTTAISVTATGGTGYAWSGGATPGTAANSFTSAGTYTVTVTDSNNGCEAIASIIITFTPDTTPPTLTCPANQTITTDNNGTGDCTGAYTIPNPMADNCPGGTWSAAFSGNGNGNPANVSGIANGSASSSITFQKGVTTVTLSATDGASNNAVTCSFTVTVNDNEPPSITCGPVTINTTPGLCTGTTTLTPPTATDNCSNSNSMVSTNTVTYEAWIFPDGTQASVAGIIFRRDGGTATGLHIGYLNNSKIGYTWNDNSATYNWTGGPTYVLNQWNHVALVIEPTKATIYLNGVPYVNIVANSVIDIAAGTTRIGDDNCCSPRHFKGSMDEVRIWSYARTQAQIIASMNAELTGNEPGLVSYYKFNQGTAGGANAGLTCLTASKGNTGTLNNFALSGSSSNWATGQIANGLAFDGVDDFVDIGTLNLNPNLLTLTNNQCSTIYPIGNTTVTWTATDAVGNSATCNQTVTVVDNQPPTVTCPATTATINTNAGASCQITIPNNVTMLSPTDNCTASGSIVEAQTIAAGAYNVSGDGSTVVVNYTATDGATVPNTTTCTVTITVNDDDAPTFTCPTPVLVLNTTGNNSCEVTIPDLVAMVSDAADNCGLAAVPVTQSIAAGAYSGVSDGNTIPVTVTVTDAATPANTTTCTVTFTVNDDDAPVVTCPAATTTIYTNAGASCEITIPNFVALLTPTDNCTASGSIVEAQTIPAGAYTTGVYHGATITVQYTATDSAIPANTTTCTVVITVNDDDAPTLVSPGNQTLNTILNTCAANYTIVDPITDNCIATWGYVLNGATIGTGSGIADGSNSNVISFNKGMTNVSPQRD